MGEKDENTLAELYEKATDRKEEEEKTSHVNVHQTGLLDVEFASQVDMDLWPLHTSVHLIRVYMCVHFHGYV